MKSEQENIFINTRKRPNESKQKPSVIPYLDESMQGVKEGLDNLKNMVTGIENQKIAINQNSFSQNTNPLRLSELVYSRDNPIFLPSYQSQSNVHEMRRSITPTKVNFNYHGQSGGHFNIENRGSHHIISQQQIGKPVQYIPIIDNRIDNVEVRRTLVPVHIKNEIPARILVNPPNQNQHRQVEESQNDEGMQTLLEQYQRLYNRLLKSEDEKKALEQTIKRLKEAPGPGSQNNQKRYKYSINMQQLHDQFYKIYEKEVKLTTAKHKQEAKRRMRELFAQAKKQVSSITVFKQVRVSRVG